MNAAILDQQAIFPAKSYMLNATNCFAWFSPEWDLEFKDIWPEHYDTNAYLGRSFFDFLSGPGIQGIYRSLFQLIRRSESEPMSLTMRCDTFPYKILMSQALSSQENGHIQIEISYISREMLPEESPAPTLEGFDVLKMCSWCQSIFDNQKTTWLPLEKALGHLPLLHGSPCPAISHGCCPSCYQTLRGKLNEYSCGR